ncbi:NAD(P)-binding domain-containing protein [Dankookia rubra]|uniref:NAD(P)-binding domain-containing protein n=1 Tax=Dankookia rubra TaxID=1442381 RepID=UPI00240E32FA|nr:NAD(P)-binding domain-containing protein [Dankookia rubra]
MRPGAGLKMAQAGSIGIQHRTVAEPSPPDLALSWVGALAHRFATRRAQVAVIGLGYAGLPMAVALAEAGFVTLGLDQDAAKLARLEARESGMRQSGRRRSARHSIPSASRSPAPGHGWRRPTRC